jgi:hypothetical protein
MFCDACGNPMAPDQPFCGRCGKQASAAAVTPPVRSRIAGHIRVLGILWLAISAFRILPGLLMWMLGPFWLGHVPFEFRGMVMAMAGSIAATLLIGGVLGFLLGWGLLERKPWSRMLAIVLGVISLFDLPFGTALGIYTLWVLLPARNEEEFRRLQRAA